MKFGRVCEIVKCIHIFCDIIHLTVRNMVTVEPLRL
jgi:hypothetical protein